jgi:Ca2+-transporting ATPase
VIVPLGFARGQDAGANILAGVSAAIAAIPEEPPILLAVILGLGAYRLLRRGVLVRRLNAEEMLGAIDLIVTDKTGTLTRNRLDVVSVTDLTGTVDGPARLERLLEGLRAEDDAWVRAEGTAPGSFTASLARAVEADGGDHTLDPAALVGADPVADGRPVSRTRSRLADGSGRVEELAIGAPETILALALPPAAERTAWVARVEARAAAGERLVAVARRPDDGSGRSGSHQPRTAAAASARRSRRPGWRASRSSS